MLVHLGTGCDLIRRPERMTIGEFFNMGGYALYVWTAFGFTAIAMLGLLWTSWNGAKKRQEDLDVLRETLRPSREGKRQSRRPQRQSETIQSD